MEVDPESFIQFGRLMGAALALGFGGIGAAVGMGMAAAKADEGIMRQPTQHGYLLRTMLIGQAVGSSPSIFALVVGLLILFSPAAEGSGYAMGFAYIGAGLSIGLGAFGSGAGCGYPAQHGCEGVARNPRRIRRLMQVMIVGQAVAQSPSIFALVISIILIFTPHPGSALPTIGIMIGSGLAIGASCLGSGYGSGYAAGGAVRGLAHWPEAHSQTFRTMLVAQGVCQTPATFGLLIALIMLYGLGELTDDWINFAKILGAGIAIGFGGIGPGIGNGLAGSSGCHTTSIKPMADALILRTMLIGQAVAQSTAMYALIIALLLLYTR